MKKAEIRISVNEDGDPLDTSNAERVNGILKDEWLYEIYELDAITATSYIPQIIKIYDNKKPHLIIDLLKPSEAYRMRFTLRKR